MNGIRASFPHELLRVTHVWPGAFLGDRKHLLGVIAIVMDPLVEEPAHLELAGLRVHPRSVQVPRLQRSDQLQALVAERAEFGPDVGDRPNAVVALLLDVVLIPRFELRQIGRLDDADPGRETALLRLDEMADDRLRAPLAGRMVPARIVIPKCP